MLPAAQPGIPTFRYGTVAPAPSLPATTMPRPVPAAAVPRVILCTRWLQEARITFGYPGLTTRREQATSPSPPPPPGSDPGEDCSNPFAGTLCGESFLNQTTVGLGNDQSSRTCGSGSYPGEDAYYAFTTSDGDANRLRVTLRNVSDANDGTVEVLHNVNGKPVLAGQMEADAGLQVRALPLESLPAGVYYFQLQGFAPQPLFKQ